MLIALDCTIQIKRNMNYTTKKQTNIFTFYDPFMVAMCSVIGYNYHIEIEQREGIWNVNMSDARTVSMFSNGVMQRLYVVGGH